MKIMLQMELHDVLRIACLLDHHRTDCASNGEGDRESPSRNRWVSQAGECNQLRDTLLKAIEVGSGKVKP